MFLRFIEIVLGLIVVAFILTQVVFPLLNQTKLFPIFRGSRNKIEDEIREVQEQLSEQELVAHLEELRAKLKSPIGQAPAPTTKQ